MNAIVAQKNPRLVKIAKWAELVFGDDAPHANTLHRWTNEGRIFPQPKKVGKNWFVDPKAEYQGD